MTYEQLHLYFGGPSKAAEALGASSRQTVDSWSRLSRIPTKWQIRAAAKSGGKLKLDSTAKFDMKWMQSVA